ncbi:MAG: uroporphyrinogen-III synthase [Sulfuricurvum sp.]|nr:uroporphyrinogen-III synthase [Sulfuricurvum sp.]MDD5386062.1 uroporphyrinogen-III synthase [Sulfuricurvum sp.]
MRPIYLVSKTSHHETVGVVHIPILSIHFLTPDIDFNLYEGIVVTSKQGVLALNHYAIKWEKLHIICVGQSTAQEVKKQGGIHIEIAQGYGESIFDALRQYRGKWLYLRPKMIASSWPARAREAGMILDEVIIYETTCNEAMEKLEIADDGVLIFTSPSSIECFLQKYSLRSTHDIVVIGKTTQNALPLGIKSTLSETTSVESCIEKAQKLVFYGKFNSSSFPT